MAGTPTTNYNIPTYADTDAPDLSGAYNDAMGIIDTQLKANADAVESASTGNYTGTNPVVVDNGQRTISVGTATPGGDGTASGLGVVRVSGKSSDIGTESQINGSTVPNAKAVADYVAAHGGTAYTGTAPIVVNNGTHEISVSGAGLPTGSSGDWKAGTQGVVSIAGNAATTRYFAEKAEDPEEPVKTAALRTVPNSYAIVELIQQSTPDASTTAKGLVQLTTSPDSADSTMAVTGSGVMRLLSDRKTNATTNVTVDMLKNLYVDNTTGVVYYKAPSE